MESGKLCECGCGMPAPLASKTDSRTGAVKGQPQRYVRFHKHRKCQSVSVGSLPERFWSKVDIRGEDECWNWRAGMSQQGYGSVKIKRKNTQAHKVAFLLGGGVLTQQKPWVLHKCDNPSCCNPAHLFAGNVADNVKDMCQKERNKWVVGERHGLSKLKKDDVLEIRSLNASGIAYQSLATRFGVSKNAIWCVCTRRTWRHV